MQSPIRLIESIKTLLDNPQELADLLKQRPLLEIVRIFSRLKPEEQEVVYDALSQERANRVVQLCLKFGNPPCKMMNQMSQPKLQAILDSLDSDDIQELTHYFKGKDKALLYSHLDSEHQSQLDMILEYPENSAGMLMETRFVSLKESMTVEEALDIIRTRTQLGSIFYLYVTNDNNELKGVIPIRRLVTTSPTSLLKDIYTPGTVVLNHQDDLSRINELFDETGYLALPVVDNNQRLLGMIQRDSILEKKQSLTEDELLTISGVKRAELQGASISKIVPLRLPWLTACLIGGLINAFLLSRYTDLLSAVIALTAFIPLLLGLGETVATQTSTLIIRSMAMGESSHQEFKSLLFKEVVIGFALGLISGIILGLIGWLWLGNMTVGLVLLVSVILAITSASLVGTAFPLGFKAFGIDPALASSAFVLTGSDLCTITIYLSTAALLLPLAR